MNLKKARVLLLDDEKEFVDVMKDRIAFAARQAGYIQRLNRRW
jgi:hypothetical protein